MVHRLIGEAGIHRASPKVRSARQRRRTTDQHLTERAAQLGFPGLQAYLADRLGQQAWSLAQVTGDDGAYLKFR